MPAYPLTLPTSQPLLTITYPQHGLWLIELHNGEDSRLTAQFINDALKPALDIVEKHWSDNRLAPLAGGQNTASKSDAGEGALIIVGKRDQDKFFSNGFQYDSIKNDPGFFTDIANPFYARLLTFPSMFPMLFLTANSYAFIVPTIAAINGHCFAGGCMLTLCCDYRVMTDGSKRRAWLCMNEVHFGSPWPLSFTSILNVKVSDPSLRRRIALEGHRFTPSEAHAAGIVDRLAKCSGTGVELGTEMVLKEAVKLAKEVSALPKQGVWGTIKDFLYRDCLEVVRLDAREHTPLFPKMPAKL